MATAKLMPKRRRKTSSAALPKNRRQRVFDFATPVRFVDLFCGIGGFRLAFEGVGAKCVFSCDWDKHSRKTYLANFGDDPTGDIREVHIASIPSFDVLCAGFPCQPFSIAGVSKKNSLGQKHGFDDPRQGNLFFHLADILAAHRPAAFVLENVKNLRRHDRGRTFEVIRSTLEDHLGYSLHVQVVDARCVVPQHRERVFLVGFRDRDIAFSFPDFPTDGPTLSTILETRVPPQYTLTDHLWKYLQQYAAKHRAAGNGFGFGLVGRNDVSRTLSARYYKDGSEILISQGVRNPRRLTPRECARLMGYPDSFQIPVSDTQAYRQFGNSVVVPIVERIAKQVISAIQPSSKACTRRVRARM